jgi:hypothetical protein
MKTTLLEYEFGDLAFAVDMACDADEYVTEVDMAHGERAVALLALTSGITTGRVVKFARKALGLNVAAIADRCGVYDWSIIGSELQPDLLIAADYPLGEVIDLLTASDRGGFVARRVG